MCFCSIMNTMFIGNQKERFNYHNTLLCLVKALQDKNITVDLRNDSCICGRLTSVDGYMNLTFENVVFCDPQGNESSFENLFIQGRNIRYVHVPETLSILQTIRSELYKKSKKPEKITEKSRKTKKAIQRHMQTVASLDLPK